MSVIKDFINEKLYRQIDFIADRDLSANRQSLWHGIKLKNAVKGLENGYLEAHTSHRYWADGIRRKESDPLYESSFWMYGWSMTRKKEYAFSWSDVIFEFDADKVRENFKVQPLTWNNLFDHNKKQQKKEFEEFVTAHYEPRSIDSIKAEVEQRQQIVDELYDKLYSTQNPVKEKEIQEQIDSYPKHSWMEEWERPRGKKLNLERCLKGIYINDYVMEIFAESQMELLNPIINHPLFKGVYQEAKQTKKIKP